MASSENIKAPEARLAFCNLIEPDKKTNQKTNKEVDYWSTSLLFLKTIDLSTLKKLAGDIAKEEWGDKAAAGIASGTIKSPFLDGDGPQGVSKKTDQRYDGFAGTTFLRVGSFQRPKMVTRAMLPVTSDDELYAGCYVVPVLNAYTWTHPTNGRGISFGLAMLQVVRDGEKLGGRGASGKPED